MGGGGGAAVHVPVWLRSGMIRDWGSQGSGSGFHDYNIPRAPPALKWVQCHGEEEGAKGGTAQYHGGFHSPLAPSIQGHLTYKKTPSPGPPHRPSSLLSRGM